MRDHLFAEARGLAKRSKSKKTTERRSVLVERAVFLGAYSMRKIDDAKKLSTSWRGRTLKCMHYSPISRPPGLQDWHHIDRHYDLERPKSGSFGVRAFCDLVVHSFIFVEIVSDDRSIDGCFIASDKTNTKGLWFFRIDAVISLMEQTAEDNPATSHMTRDPRTGEW